MNKRGLVVRVIPALLACMASGYAAASGFQLIEQNASGIGNAYAGSAAVAENASTIFYNPAGMTQLQAREFSGGLSAVKPSFQFNNGASTNVGAFANSGGDDGGTLGLIPNAYMSWAVNKDLYLGLGIGAPFGLMTEYKNPWIGAAQSIRRSLIGRTTWCRWVLASIGRRSMRSTSAVWAPTSVRPAIPPGFRRC